MALRALSLAVCLGGILGCRPAKTNSRSPFPTAQLPASVEGVVFRSTSPGDWTAEQRRVGFRSVQYIRPTRMVARSHTAIALPRAPLDLSGFTYAFNGRTQSIDDFMEQMNVAGLLVLQNGRVVLERYANGHSPSSA